MRILITGIGGVLGTRVAALLEADESVAAIMGVDLDPPQRPLRRSKFHRIDPRNRIRTSDVVRRFAPTGVIHLGTYEPDARSNPKEAIELTAAGTIAALLAAAETGSLDRIVVRSGIEVYGRRRHSSLRPDEDDQLAPTTPWGHSLRHAELIARESGDTSAASVTSLRFAPLVGSHYPSPLSRVLRQRLVPFAALSDPPFSVIHHTDAAAAVVAALHSPFDGAVNVVGEGSITVSRAALLGRHVPVPVCGLGWRAARSISSTTGSPMPAHVYELLTHGRLADGSKVEQRIGWTPSMSTAEAIASLYKWAEVTPLTPIESAA